MECSGQLRFPTQSLKISEFSKTSEFSEFSEN